MALHASGCVRACVQAELFVDMRPCDVLSLERAVICKSALPRAGGVKLGQHGRQSERGMGWDGQRRRRRDAA